MRETLLVVLTLILAAFTIGIITEHTLERVSITCQEGC